MYMYFKPLQNLAIYILHSFKTEFSKVSFKQLIQFISGITIKLQTSQQVSLTPTSGTKLIIKKI